jgi:hypothetical protein
VGNCHIVESPSSSHSLCKLSNSLLSLCPRALLRSSLLQGRTYNPISRVPRHILCQRITCQYLLPSIVTSCTSTLLANTLYSRILHQRIAWQYPLLSIVASCTSALLANTHSSLLSPLVPAHCLPIPTPLHCRLSCQRIACQYPLLSIVASCASALLAISLFTAILKSPASALLNYKSHPVVLLHTLS